MLVYCGHSVKNTAHHGCFSGLVIVGWRRPKGDHNEDHKGQPVVTLQDVLMAGGAGK